MHIKIFSEHGKGVGASAINYLMGDKDGERVTAPVLLKGNLISLERSIDTSPHKWKYTSGVLSFSEVLTDEQKLEIIDSFEAHHFPAMSHHNFEVAYVEHNDHNRTEIHFLIARIDLESGKHLNAFPPKWEEHSYPWRNAINIEYGFTRPDEHVNLATLIRDKFHPEKAKKNDVISLCTDYVSSRFEFVKSRDDVVLALSELEDLGIKVQNESARYISVSAKGFEKNIRLKGAIYDQSSYDNRGFRYSYEREDIREFRGSEEEYRECCATADAARERRASYNRKRFKTDCSSGASIFEIEALPQINARKIEDVTVTREGFENEQRDSGSENSEAHKTSNNHVNHHINSSRVAADNDSCSGSKKLKLWESIKYETQQLIKQFNTYLDSAREHFITSVSGLIYDNHRAIESHRGEASIFRNETGRVPSGIQEARRISNSATERIATIESGRCTDICRIGRSLVDKLNKKRKVLQEEAPELTPLS
jgi:hypothetical protein